MPQVDLETLVCGGGGDGKVACETLIAGGEGRPDPPSEAAEDPDLPAESFQVPIEYEIDWVDVNAVYDQENSTKGNTNPKSKDSNPKPISNSNRFSGSLKAKGPIIGLPNKIQHSRFVTHSTRRPPNVRIFPKKSRPSGGGGGKSAVPEFEPSSPKVSCFGKVLSVRERERCRKARRRSPDESGEERGAGCWVGLAAIFRCGCGNRTAAAERFEDGSAATSTNLRAVVRNIPAAAAAVAEDEPAKPTPGLGGMKRFKSGRKAASWGDLEMEGDGHVAVSDSLDHHEGVWGRRSIGSLEDAKRELDWESAGSASV